MRHPQQFLNQRRHFLADMLRGLKLLEADLEAVRRDVQLLYVADFAAIFAYVYQSVAHDSSAVLPSESPERVFARRLIALQLVFESADRKLLLIPPYAAELRNHVRGVAVQIEIADLDTRKLYRSKLETLISQSPEFGRFIEVAQAKELLPAAVRQKALEVGKKFFPELYAVLGAREGAGLRSLNRLFQDGVLQDADVVIPVLKGFEYAQATEQADGWYKALIEKRGRRRAYQTFIDALACAYIQRANECLNQDRQAVLFVAPSAEVRSILRHHPLIHLPNAEATECVRDLDYFLLAFSHRSDLGAVRESVRSIKSLLATLDAAERAQGALPPGQNITIGEETEERWREAENYLLMGNAGLLDALIGGLSNGTQDDAFLALLRELNEAARLTGAEMEREGLELINTLKANIFELYKWIPPTKSVASFVPLKIALATPGVRITFPGFRDDAPVILRFVDPSVVELARSLRAVAGKVSQEALLEMRRVVLGAASELDARGEHFLLAGYMLALEGKPDPALRELERGLAIASDIDRAELSYLAGMIRRRLFESNRAVELLEAALKSRPDDERFLLEAAKVYWLKGYSERPTNPNKARECLRRAFGLVEEAISHVASTSDAFFQAQLYNVRAFVSCELALDGESTQSDELETAAHSVAQIERLVPENQWIGRFHDTRAWCAFARAKILLRSDSEQHDALLNRALADIRRALELETTVDSRKRLLQQHRASIETELMRNP